MSKRIGNVVAVLAVAGVCSLAHAARVESFLTSQAITAPAGGERTGQDIAVVDVGGIASWDGFGSPNNTVIHLWVGPFNRVNGAGFDVVIQTLVPESWRDDMVIHVTSTANEPSVLLIPGSLDGPGGPTAYSSDGIFKFVGHYPDVMARSDGLIRLEFLEKIDDAPGKPDGLWVSGRIYLQTAHPIPIPSVGSYAFASVLAGVFGVSRRRISLAGR